YRFLVPDSAPTDIPTAESLRPVDRIDGGVGARSGFGDRCCAGGDVEDATATGDNGAVAEGSAGVADLDAGERLGAVEALDRRAGRVVAGVASCRHHHGERGVVAPARRRVGEAAARGGVEELEEVAVEAHQKDLRFGVAEADVVLDEFGAA